MTDAQAPDTFELVSVGPPHFASLVAQSLRKEGLSDVSREPPQDRCGGGSAVDAVIVVYVVRRHSPRRLQP